MTEIIDAKTGEIVEEKGLIPTKTEAVSAIAKLVKDADMPIYEALQTMSTFDWRKLTPPQIALLIMQKPFAAQGGGQMYLNFKQSLLFATRCFELNVSPFSSEVWFDPNRASVNLTLEGKKQVAKSKGVDLGPPKFEELTREFKDLPRQTPIVEDLKKAGFTKDFGIKAKMRVGDPALKEEVEYIAWLTEWYVPRSPVWQAKPTHMLQTRATEKAISLALGTGASDMIVD